jgi:hypothetical protein
LEIEVVNDNLITDIETTSLYPTCNPSDGSISVSFNGGVGPFSYQWFSYNSISYQPYYQLTNINQSSSTATNLNPGDYVFIITDEGANCQVNSFINLDDIVSLNYPYVLNATMTIQQPCNYNEGQIEVEITNGAQPFTYVWNRIVVEDGVTLSLNTGHTSNNANELQIGDYTVTVTDANNCQQTLSTSLNGLIDDSHFDYPDGITITSPSQQINDFKWRRYNSCSWRSYHKEQCKLFAIKQNN